MRKIKKTALIPPCTRNIDIVNFPPFVIMGQMVSSAIESIQDDSQKQQLANDALNQMQELGHQQINSFMHDVT